MATQHCFLNAPTRQTFGASTRESSVQFGRARRPRPAGGSPVPSTYDVARWFHPQLWQTSTTYTRNSPYSAAISINSEVFLTLPAYCPSSSPYTYVTCVTFVLRQIGQRSSVGSPWYLAARSRYGCASQASAIVVWPERTDASAARRARAYSTTERRTAVPAMFLRVRREPRPIDTSPRPGHPAQVNSRLPTGEQSPMLGTVTPIYRTEISARDIVQIHEPYPPGRCRGPEPECRP
jgi:hypothetical protein